MCDLIFAVESMDTANYADDTTPYACCKDFDLIIEKLKVKTNEILQWFNKNAMKANADKCHLLLTTNEEKKFLLKEKHKIVKRKICLES